MEIIENINQTNTNKYNYKIFIDVCNELLRDIDYRPHWSDIEHLKRKVNKNKFYTLEQEEELFKIDSSMDKNQDEEFQRVRKESRYWKNRDTEFMIPETYEYREAMGVNI